MSRTLTRVSTPAVVASGLVVLLAGAATAAYRTAVAGAGTGTATPAAAGTPLTLSATGAGGTGLYPGGPGADVTLSVTNPYARPVTLVSVAPAGPITAVPVSGRTCVAHAVTFAAPATGLPVTVPAHGTVGVPLTAVAVMGLAAESGCQGATFSIPLTVTGRL